MGAAIKSTEADLTLRQLTAKSRRNDDGGYTIIKCKNSASREGIMEQLINIGYHMTGPISPFELRPFIFINNGGTGYFSHTDDNQRDFYLSENIWWLE